MMLYGRQEAMTNHVRAVAARNGEDPRLVEVVYAGWSVVREAWIVEVRLRDGRSAVRSPPAPGDWSGAVPSDQLATQLLLEAAGEAFGQAPPPDDLGFAKSGLPSDYWWNEHPQARADKARRWVKDVLLRRPEMSDAHADRFIASLDPPKREELVARAVQELPATGF